MLHGQPPSGLGDARRRGRTRHDGLTLGSPLPEERGSVDLASFSDPLHRVRHYLASRRVHVLGSTPHPTALFMGQMVRLVTAADYGVLVGPSRAHLRSGSKWSRAVRHQLGDAGIRVVLTPARAPNVNAYAERFVRSIKKECRDRMIPLGKRHFWHAVADVSRATIANGIIKVSTTS